MTTKLFVAYLDDSHQIIVGKSNPMNEIFDVLIFASHCIEKVVIPPSIKHISSYAFSYCRFLKTIEFSNESKLLSIGKNAFTNSSVQSISFPSSLNKIGKRLFSYCASLKSIEFNENSNIKVLEDFIFYGSTIKYLTIPSSVIELKEDCLYNVSKLKKVSISPLNKNFSYLDKDKKMIAGKSIINNDDYDVL